MKNIILFLIAIIAMSCQQVVIIKEDPNGVLDTIIVSACLSGIETVEQETILKSTSPEEECIPRYNLEVYNYRSNQLVSNSDFFYNSDAYLYYQNPLGGHFFTDVCFDYLLPGLNQFLLTSIDESGNVTGIGYEEVDILSGTKTDIDDATIYTVHSTLKFNVENLIDDNFMYKIFGTIRHAAPIPEDMLAFDFRDFTGVNGDFQRPVWQLNTLTSTTFSFEVSSEGVTKLGLPDSGNFYTVWNNAYESGDGVEFHYNKYGRENLGDPWKPIAKGTITETNTWVYGGIETKITFIYGASQNKTGESCLTVTNIEQEVIEETHTLN